MHPQLQRVIERTTGLPFTDVECRLRPPLEIQGSNLYDLWVDGRHLIAKEWTNPKDLPDAPQREYAALHLLNGLDIAPRPVFFNPAIAPIVVYEFMEGEMWDRQKPSAHQLAQLAEVWLTVHRVPIDSPALSKSHQEFSVRRLLHRYRRQFGQYKEWSERSFAPGLEVVPYLDELMRGVDDVVKELDRHTPLLCFSRADPRFANVIQRPDGRIGLIDWEDSGLRDPAHDAADLILHPNNEDLLTPTEWQGFLQPYLAEREGFDSAIQERMHLYTAIFPLFWLGALLAAVGKLAESGRLAEWQINGMEPNQRLRRYLARGLAWPKRTFAVELDDMGSLRFFPE